MRKHPTSVPPPWAATQKQTPQCPSWCVTAHGEHHGEDDWLHLSEPIRLTRQVEARMAVTRGPGGWPGDGPYLMIGSEEFTLAEAASLGAAITAVAKAAQGMSVLEEPDGALPVLDPQLSQH